MSEFQRGLIVCFVFAGGLGIGFLIAWLDGATARKLTNSIHNLRKAVSEGYNTEMLCTDVINYANLAIKNWSEDDKIDFYLELSRVTESEAAEIRDRLRDKRENDLAAEGNE
jgi:hypothetical protein